MKKLLSFILISFSTITAKADYVPVDLYAMMLKAEKIVYGEIISLDSLTFTLEIEGSVTGDTGNVTVKRFQDWPCAHRWTDYRTGQRLFLFLHTSNGAMETMSAGNEGELPICQDSIYINSSSLIPPPPKGLEAKRDTGLNSIEFFESRTHMLFGEGYYGYSMSLQNFLTAIHRIRGCFDIETKYDHYRVEKAKLLCSVEKTQKLIAIDKIFRWTYKELIIN
ncbi:hypothetical protein [Halocola ammonii]